jgi:hypothetical protein
MCLTPSGLALDRAVCRPVSFAEVWLERGESTIDPNQACPPGLTTERKASAMTSAIGVDPHKGSHTTVAIDNNEHVVDEIRVRSCSSQPART